MGKTVIKQQASSTISKKDHRRRHQSKLHKQQHQHHHLLEGFDSLINDLKPKVYITDSSSFKQLVQDLTGNNNNGSPNSSITSSSSSSKVHDDPDLHQHHQVQFSGEPLVSAEAPITATTTTSSEEFCRSDDNYMNDTDELIKAMYTEDEDLDGLFFCRSTNNQMVQNDTAFEDILACDYDQINYLESLLFDDDHQAVVEQPLITDPFYAQITQPAEISVYDYDFSGLIN